jgi:hypothetical protein
MEKGKPLKDRLNSKSLHEFALVVKQFYKDFKVDEFIKSILDEKWDNLELMARGRQISLKLGEYLPKNYKEAIRNY